MLNFLNTNIELETTRILKKCIDASRELAEFKIAVSEFISYDALYNIANLIDAKYSLELEDLPVSYDNIFKELVGIKTKNKTTYPALKAIQIFTSQKYGASNVFNNKLLTILSLSYMQASLEDNKAGLRREPGKRIWGDDGELIYTPPKMFDEVFAYMQDWEKLANDIHFCNYDPLVKLALLHSQFIAIQPFASGNELMTRFITSIYLNKEGLLFQPIFMFSPYLFKHKDEYERLIHSQRMNGNYDEKLNKEPAENTGEGSNENINKDAEEWILFYLEAIEQSAISNKKFMKSLSTLIRKHQHIIYKNSKIYSRDLRNLIFKFPYLTIKLFAKELGISKQLATSRLNKLVKLGILEKQKSGSSNIYINIELIKLVESF